MTQSPNALVQRIWLCVSNCRRSTIYKCEKHLSHIQSIESPYPGGSSRLLNLTTRTIRQFPPEQLILNHWWWDKHGVGPKAKWTHTLMRPPNTARACFWASPPQPGGQLTAMCARCMYMGINVDWFSSLKPLYYTRACGTLVLIPGAVRTRGAPHKPWPHPSIWVRIWSFRFGKSASRFVRRQYFGQYR